METANRIQCKRCGEIGDLSKIKLYPIPDSPGKSEFLCERCFSKIIQKEKVKDLKYKSCPTCKHFIKTDSTRCEYCGKMFEENRLDRKEICTVCGATIAKDQKYCYKCGKVIVKEKQKVYVPRLEEPKAIVKIPKKTAGLIIVAIIFSIISIYIFYNGMNGVQYGGITATDFGPNANFYLYEYEIIDNAGTPAIKFNYSSTTGAEILIFDMDGNIVSRDCVYDSYNSKTMNLGKSGRTLCSGNYIMKAYSGERMISEDYCYLMGPKLKINSIQLHWIFDGTSYDTLDKIDINVENLGNAPAYVYKIDLKIDVEEYTTYNLIDVLEKKQKSNLEASIGKTNIFHTLTKYIYIKLLDKSDNVLAEYSEIVNVA